MTQRPITNDKIYESVDRMRLELKGDIIRLENKFDVLEAGRLTSLEKKYTDLALKLQMLDVNTKTTEKTLSNKFVALGAIGMVLLTSLTSAIFFWLIGRMAGGVK